MPESEWGETRIAELRRLAQATVEATYNYIHSDSVEDLRELEEARVAYNRASPNAASVLSLLDALESARRASTAWEMALEIVRDERDAMQRRAKAAEADWRQAEQERDGFKEAFDDVMGALSAALDGDEMYGERPAELVWRLRDQRDELNAEVTALRNGEDYDAEGVE